MASSCALDEQLGPDAPMLDTSGPFSMEHSCRHHLGNCIVEALSHSVVAFCSILSGKALRLDSFDEDFRDIGLEMCVLPRSQQLRAKLTTAPTCQNQFSDL